jgi:3-oxoadipate enol-lactonase/4-carboxymuconolactone decarboxylase
MPLPLRQRWIASRIIDHTTGRWLFHTVTAERRRELVKRGDENLPSMNPDVVTEEYLSALDTKLEEYAKRVDLPVLVIAGAKDIIVPLKRLENLVSLMRDGTLVVMNDQGHLAPIEKPATTATISKRFINGLKP